MARVANCPSCGGQVEFKAGSSLLSICPYCTNVVGRIGGDVGELEILGKVAPLAEIGSPLRLGSQGRHDGKSFALIGRAQLDHGAGPWNEWYAAFDDGDWGWVAEAQGAVYISFEVKGGELPRFHQARVGSNIQIRNTSFVVAERRTATFVSGEGELPFTLRPSTSYRYCDLTGPGGVFGTIDYGNGDDPPRLFVGKKLEYSDLFGADILADRVAAQVEHKLELKCPQCASPLALRAPDEALCVTCPSCDALLDCSKGKTLFMLQAAGKKGPEPLLALGSSGELFGARYTVYAFLVRSVTVEGVRYPWTEYLLRDEKKGAFRWLVESNGHFNFVEPVSAGDVKASGRDASFREQSFRFFQGGSARVDYLKGELYWKVKIGETVATADYVAPPLMLSRESSEEEINWSLGTYVARATVASAFRLQRGVATRGVSPNQPNPTSLRGAAKAAAAMTVLALLLGVLMALRARGEALLSAPIPTAKPELFHSPSFQVTRRSNLELALYSDRPGVFAEGMLLGGSQPQSFGIALTHEDSSVAGLLVRKVYLGDVSPGNYSIQLTPEWQVARSSLELRVRSGVFLYSHLFFVLALIWAVPSLLLFAHFSFEKSRWAESG